MALAEEATKDDDKGLTGPVITFDSLSPEFQKLCSELLVKRDRVRVMNGQPKYETVQGMIDAYAELGLVKGWSREEAESEVVRFLQRRVLQDEGGNDGEGMDTAAFAMLGLNGAIIVYATAVNQGWLPPVSFGS